MGRDAIGQVWYTGLSTPNGHLCEAHARWQGCYGHREQGLAPAYAQRLRDTAWFEPMIPAQYMSPDPRWGSVSWRDKPVQGKEFVVSRNGFGLEWPKQQVSKYVPGLSAPQGPPYTRQDFRHWVLEPYCHSTARQSPPGHMPGTS